MLNRISHDDRGQELAEYAIAFFVLFLLILGVIEFGIIMFSQNTLSNAVREGARFAVARDNQVHLPASSPEIAWCDDELGLGFSDIVQRTCDRALALDPSRLQVTVTWPAIDPTSTVSPPRPDRNLVFVRVSYSYIPFFGLLGQFMPGGLTLGSQSMMRLE